MFYATIEPDIVLRLFEHRHADVLVELLRENRAHLDVEVLITGSDAAAREVGRELSTPMKKLHNPVWNHPNAPYMRKG